MATPDILDFEALLAPVSEDNPVGVDLRADAELSAVYYQIRDARSQARSLERQAIRDGEELPGMLDEWRTVIEQGTEVLSTRSKSLEIVAWLIEALLRRNGFAGVRDGYRLARELVEAYWDDIYPLPDEDGVATRVAALAGLNGEDGPGTLEEPFINVEITEGRSFGPFRVWHCSQAAEVGAIGDPEERERRIESGAVSMEQLETAISETSQEFFRNLVDDLAASREEYASFCAAIEPKCGDYSFPTSAVRNGLESIHETVRRITRDVLPQEPDGEEEGGSEGDGAGPARRAARSRKPGGPIANRADALRTLTEVANFFGRTEPHSPISYTLRQVVRWAQMPLPRLLTELIPDEHARDGYFRLVGISGSDEEPSIAADDYQSYEEEEEEAPEEETTQE